VLGLALICPIGTAVEHAERTVPEHQVLRPDPELLDSLDDRLAEEFAEGSVVQTPEILRRFRAEIMSGLDIRDRDAMARIRQRWQFDTTPESGTPYQRPTLILAGRQDSSVGYLDQFALLPHYPRASFAVLDVAGHNLQIEQPGLFDTLVLDWLDRVAAES
jgi:pimeloyl-ACP methyl ester carboxylesterase